MRATENSLMRAFVLIAIAAATACSKQAEVVQEEVAPEIATAEERTLDIRAEAAGLVEPITTVEIKSKASGEVTSVAVETGQEVRRGTLLVEIEPRDVRNALAQAEADFEVAKARLTTAESQYKRVQELRKANVATEQELESVTLEQANAAAALVKARTNVELAKERMNDVTIRAPLDGMIIEKTVEPGSVIASASGSVSGGSVLLKMADLSLVQVRALVDQTDIGRVQPGQTARVSVEAYPSRNFDGVVVKIEPQAVVDQNVTMFPVLIQLENNERLLKPGMNTEIEVEIARRPNAVVIPNDAVVNTRDVHQTAIALGLTEENAQKKIDAMRSGPFAQESSGPQGGAELASDRRGAAEAPPAATKPAGTDGQSPSSPPSQAAQTPQQGGTGVVPSAECQRIMAKFRTDFQSLTDEERTKARACRPQMGGQGRNRSATGQRPGANNGRGGGNFQFGGGGGNNQGRANRARPSARPAVVFVPTATGPEPRQVTLGYSDLDYTEVISGLKPGDKIYLVTAARLMQTQRENLERMRQRMSGPVPGMTGPQQGGPGRGR
jgi:HlyD family secretion protein